MRSWARLRAVGPALGLALSLCLLASGCGDPIEEYCEAMEGHRDELAEMVSADSGPTSLLKHLTMLRDLADQAPRDIADDWQVFLNAVENLDRVLDRADLAPEDFKEGKPPAGTAPEDVKAIAGAANELAGPEVAGAAGVIEGQARDVCKVNFGL